MQEDRSPRWPWLTHLFSPLLVILGQKVSQMCHLETRRKSVLQPFHSRIWCRNTPVLHGAGECFPGLRYGAVWSMRTWDCLRKSFGNGLPWIPSVCLSLLSLSFCCNKSALPDLCECSVSAGLCSRQKTFAGNFCHLIMYMYLSPSPAHPQNLTVKGEFLRVFHP